MLDNFTQTLKVIYKIPPNIHFIPQIFFSITRIQVDVEIFPKEMNQDHSSPNKPKAQTECLYNNFK